jgi:hypothetical protein
MILLGALTYPIGNQCIGIDLLILAAKHTGVYPVILSAEFTIQKFAD